MKLKDILKNKGSKVWAVKANQTIHDALEVLVNQKIGALLVYGENDQIVGIISERDIMRGFFHKGKDLETMPVTDWMTQNVIIGSPEDDTSYLMGVMTEKRVRHIPVISGGKLEGIISIGDVVKSQLQDSQYEIHYLKEYIYGSRQGQ
jgi:CBS domain-containing protein